MAARANRPRREAMREALQLMNNFEEEASDDVDDRSYLVQSGDSEV